MKKLIMPFAFAALAVVAASCIETGSKAPDSSESSINVLTAGAASSEDNVSQKNVVGVAIGSKDHATLVKAVKQANLVEALSNAGPFTVFAPTDAAFSQLPSGTLDDLMRDENKDKLTDILQYHVSVGVFRPDMLQDGQSIGQVNGGNISISKKGEDIIVNGTAKVLGTVPASNGLVYVVDKVLLPK